MKILEMRIDVFGGLKDRRITLSDGLNVLFGENESGKSTWMLFIKFMLYGMPRRGNEERDRSVSRTEHRAAGSLTFSHEGEEYRIERSFTENGRTGNDRLNIYRLSDGAEVFRGREAGEAFLRVPREVFESSAFVGQMKCGVADGKKGNEAIRNLLSTANEDTDMTKIVDKLEKLRVGYRPKKGKGGKLYELSLQLQQEQKRLERAEHAQIRLSELTVKTESLRKRYEDAEAALERSNRLLNRLGKRELLRRFDALRSREGEIPRIDREIQALCDGEGWRERIPTEADAVRLCALADRLEEDLHISAEAEKALADLEANADFDPEGAELGERLEREGGADGVFLRAEGLKKKKQTLRVFGSLSLCAALGAGAFGILIGPFLPWIAATFVLGLLGMFMLGRSAAAARRARVLAEEYGVKPSALCEHLLRCAEDFERRRAYEVLHAQRQTELRMAEAQKTRDVAALASELARIGFAEEATAEAGRAQAARIRGFLSRYGVLSQKREVLRMSVEQEASLLSAYDEAALREEIGEDVSEPLDLAAAEREQQWNLAKRDSLRRDKERAELEKSSLAAMAEDPLPIADRVEELKGAYRRAEEYCDALELALESLNDASDAMSGNVTPLLGKRAGELMEFISGGRYGILRAGSDLVPSLDDADGRHVPSDLLSGGTRDAAYLSLRIALMLQIYEGELPPLIMDESLCQLDGGRMERILMLLGKLCEGHFQCLLFTCHEREGICCEEKEIPCERIAL